MTAVLPKEHLSILLATMIPSYAGLAVMPSNCNLGKHMEMLTVRYGELAAQRAAGAQPSW